MMSAFIIASLALLVIALLLMLLPLRHAGGSRPSRGLAAVLLLLLPLATLGLYHMVGTPAALDTTNLAVAPAAGAGPSLEEAVAELERRLEASPEDPDGWALLGRSYAAMERYALAENAYRQALQRAPDDPVVMVELAEAMTFASGQPGFSPEALQLLDNALARAPDLQKGLWLRGIAAAQQGDDPLAVTLWQRLLNDLDPNGSVYRSVSEQVQAAQQRLGDPVATDPAADGIGIAVQVSLASDLPEPRPPGLTLYVYARLPGSQGMPLAVRQVRQPVFPMALTLGDGDLLLPGSSLADHGSLEISARLSMSGSATPAAGDLEASASEVSADADSTTTVALVIDQQREG